MHIQQTSEVVTAKIRISQAKQKFVKIFEKVQNLITRKRD